MIMLDSTHKLDSAFWQTPSADIFKKIGAWQAGLNSVEAATRLQKFDPNLIHGEKKRAVVVQFLAKFRNPLVIILMMASALSALT